MMPVIPATQIAATTYPARREDQARHPGPGGSWVLAETTFPVIREHRGPAASHWLSVLAMAAKTESARSTSAGPMWRWVTRRRLSAVSEEQRTPRARRAAC